MSQIGRPPVLNETKKKTILALLTVGCSRSTAAHYVNCDPKTIYNTAQRDPVFAEGLARAESSSEFAFLSRIFKAAEDPKYWRSAAWGLERMFPDRFGVRSPESVTPQQLAQFISRFTEMLVEEVPVAEYRKKILLRLGHFTQGDITKLPAIQNPIGKKSPQKT